MIPIEKMTIGAAPTDFEFARTGQGATGQWVVLEDASAASKRAIEQSNTDRTDHRFPLAIYQPTSTKNVEVSLRFKPLAGRVDQAGGIAVRLTSPGDYYLVRANALEDNVRFYRIVKGRRQQLATANIKVSSGEWHTLGIKAENDRFTGRLTESSCIQPPTRLSRLPGVLRFGPSRTASRASIRSTFRFCHDLQHEAARLRPGSHQGHVRAADRQPLQTTTAAP